MRVRDGLGFEDFNVERLGLSFANTRALQRFGVQGAPFEKL